MYTERVMFFSCIWEKNKDVEQNVHLVHITRLRQVLKKQFRLIVTKKY